MNQSGFTPLVVLVVVAVLALGWALYYAERQGPPPEVAQPVILHPGPPMAPPIGSPPPASPSGPTQGGTRAKSTTVLPHVPSGIPSTIGLAKYPDELLDSLPTTPISVEFLVEHRT